MALIECIAECRGFRPGDKVEFVTVDAGTFSLGRSYLSYNEWMRISYRFRPLRVPRGRVMIYSNWEREWMLGKVLYRKSTWEYIVNIDSQERTPTKLLCSIKIIHSRWR